MLKDYAKRLLVCLCGLALYALGNYFGVLAGSAGTNGWNTMALGLSNVTGMTFGTGVFTIGIALLVIDYPGKGKLGVGTFLNVFLISWLSDVFLRVLTFIPDPPNTAVGVFYALLGQMIIAFATVVYMKTALAGARRGTEGHPDGHREQGFAAHAGRPGQIHHRDGRTRRGHTDGSAFWHRNSIGNSAAGEFLPVRLLGVQIRPAGSGQRGPRGHMEKAARTRVNYISKGDCDEYQGIR